MRVTLIGMGCGSEKMQTVEALEALGQAEVLIGSERLLDGVRRQGAARSDADDHDKTFCSEGMRGEEACNAARPGEAFCGPVSFYEAVSAEAVYEAICQEAGRNICVLYSGDTGFYSGVRKLLPLLEKGGIEVRVIPGISSLQLFSARIGSPWQDWNLVSAHGTDCNAVNAVMQGKPAFFLTGGKEGPADLCKQLVRAGLGMLTVTIGEALSYDAERIYRCSAGEAASMDFAPLSVMLAEAAPMRGSSEAFESDGSWREATGNGQATAGFGRTADENEPGQATVGVGQAADENEPRVTMVGVGREAGTRFACSLPTIPDNAFVRGSVPMTKRDVRAVVLGRMRIRPGDVIWDVGAGTGSVSVEMALANRLGQVFAVECKEEACRLIETNRRRFGAWNLSMIAGKAPECLRQLPPPDAVFIGGSKGMMAEIVAMIHQKNENARICITAIALETLQASISALTACGWTADVTQISVSHAEKAGSLHLMMANNPIFLITNGD